MRSKIFTSAVFGVSLAWAMALPARADINLDSSSLSVRAYDGQGLFAVANSVNPASLPYSNDAHDVSDGQAYSQADYDFTAGGDTGVFRFDFDQAHTSGGSHAQSRHLLPPCEMPPLFAVAHVVYLRRVLH